MSLYYIHINTDRLSLELDSDILSLELDSDINYQRFCFLGNNHLNFKPGDILTIESNANKFMICELNGERIGYYKNNLKLDYDKSSSASIQRSITILKAIDMKLASDITKMVERNEKLKNLGI